MKFNTKHVKTVAVVLLVLAAILFSLFGVQKRPALQVATYRKCDFISIEGSTKVICTDATQWMAIELTPTEVPPTPTPPDVRGPALGVAPVVAAPASTPVVADTSTTVRYSHYWPPLGGTNCSNFVDGVCISAMASGKPWGPYVGTAVACPAEWAFGTTVELDDRTWTCLDRGGAIKYVDGVPWVDFLEATGVYDHGSIITVNVIHP